LELDNFILTILLIWTKPWWPILIGPLLDVIRDLLLLGSSGEFGRNNGLILQNHEWETSPKIRQNPLLLPHQAEPQISPKVWVLNNHKRGQHHISIQNFKMLGSDHLSYKSNTFVIHSVRINRLKPNYYIVRVWLILIKN
jgi:hypothetical protein